MSANPNGLRMPRAELHRHVARLKAEGLTFKQIAERLGRSMSSITSAYYDPTGEKARARKRKRHGICVDCGEPVYNSGARETQDRCMACHHSRVKTNLDARGGSSRRLRWSDEAVFALIHSVAISGEVTMSAYLEARKLREMPSIPALVRRFGSWANAVDAAGCRLRSGRRGPYASRVPTEGLLCAVEDCWADLGHPPTYEEFNAWAARHGVPSAQTVRNRFVTWRAALEACRPAMELAA